MVLVIQVGHKVLCTQLLNKLLESPGCSGFERNSHNLRPRVTRTISQFLYKFMRLFGQQTRRVWCPIEHFFPSIGTSLQTSVCLSPKARGEGRSKYWKHYPLFLFLLSFLLLFTYIHKRITFYTPFIKSFYLCYLDVLWCLKPFFS